MQQYQGKEAEFLEAIFNNDFKKFKECYYELEKEASCNTDLFNIVAFKYAAAKNQVKFVDFLLNTKISNYKSSNYGFNPFKEACYIGNIEILELLLKDLRTDLKIVGNEGFMTACSENHFDIVKLLINEKDIDPSYWNQECLVKAVCNQNIDIVKLLLNDSRIKPNDNFDILRYAIQRGNIEIVQLLLEHGSNPALYKNKALITAVKYNNLNAFKLLLKDKRVNPFEGFESAFWEALSLKKDDFLVELADYEEFKQYFISSGEKALFKKYKTLKAKKNIKRNVEHFS